MRLSVDQRGVNFEFDAPKCDIGDRALELVRSGVYSGCSFEFYPQDYDVEERGEEVLIKHRRFKLLEALTIGMSPAYRQTTVNARELYEGTPGFKAEQARLAKEKAEREAEEQARIAEDMKRRERVLAMNAIEDEELDKIHY